MSRMPSSAMCSVRGIGVAESVSTSTVGAQRLEPLLVLHAEALLLVDDDEAEVREAHVLAEQPVRADDDVHRAVGEARERLARSRAARAEARERLDADRVGREALAEGAHVLLGEHRRRHEHGDLPAGGDDLEAARSATSVLP